MKRFYTLKQLIIVLLLLLPLSLSAAKRGNSQKSTRGGKGVVAASVNDDNEALQTYEYMVLRNFLTYYEIGIDEKLYLQTDKQYYSSGEQIWFKGYLLNAITHVPLNFSNFIYVELADSKGKLVSRVKVRRDNGGFNGYISMDPTIEPGDYTLRGYTRWMANKDEGFFYNKNIKIVSAITESAAAAVDPDDKAAVKAAERAAAAEAAAEAKLLAEAEKAAEEAKRYSVQFFPEGGALLEGVSQIVAFKATAADGLSVEVTGEIYDSNDEVVAEIASSHKGMGMFQFMAEAGNEYYAAMKSADGLEISFYLPKVEPRGVAIKVSKIGDKAFYQVLTNDAELIKGGHVVIHSRGQIISVTETSLEPAAVPGELLRSGISTFAVVDAENQVLSERLVFKKPTAMPSLKFKCSAENFAKRDLARFRVTVLDEDGAPAKGDFAVSVTDNSSIESDPAKDNMLSYLLLCSDIRGHIEDPGLYFEDDSPAMNHKLDLLMRTQAWRRFDLSEVLNAEVVPPDELFEDVAHISGSVKGFFGNHARRPRVAVFCSKMNYFDVFDLDESSKFRLVGLDMPDSTTYILRAQGRNGGGAMTLNIDPERFPKLGAGVFSREEKADPPTAFVNQSKDKFFYEGGMQTIELESISVTTTKRPDNAAGISATQSHSREILETMSGLTIGDVIQSFPSMSISTETMEVFYRGGTESARFIVDGADEEYMNIMTMMADDMEQIDFFSGAEAAAFSDSSGGVFTITLRAVRLEERASLPNVAFVSQLGYQHPATFFQPAYEVASVRSNWPPDYRTTIYWNGELKADDYGNINFGFYTADKPTSYTVTIEGITESGEVCRGTTTMERTKVD